MTRCRHGRTWILCGGRWEWCYQCGALRELTPLPNINSSAPKTRWARCTGRQGENPWPLKPLPRKV